MTMDKKERDRQRAKELYAEYKRKRVELIEKFGSKCFICQGNGRLEFHHMKYHKEGKYGHSMWRRIQMLKEIEEHPEDFRLLCNLHHKIVSWIEVLSPEQTVRLLSIIQFNE